MPEDTTLFGQLAVAKGLIDDQVLEDLLARQNDEEPRRPLGQMLLADGLITEDQIADILATQKRMRQAFVIKGYELLQKIGTGGMGTVYKARKEGIEKIVAIKLLSPSLAKSKNYIDRFFREARSAGMLNHPNIVSGFDVGESNGYYYFAMEYVEGETLTSMLKREKRLSEELALDIVLKVAAGLQHAAEHHLVHRDIKPDNILITSSGTVKLADLGLAKRTGKDPSTTQDGRAICTPFYSSPEQARGANNIDIRSDIYSLGVTLYRMIAATVPFTGDTPAVVLAKHLAEELPPLSQMTLTFSEPTAKLIRKMMAKDPAHRHQTPQELIDDINRLRKMPRTVGSSRENLRRKSKTGVPVIGVMVVIIALLLGVVIHLLKNGKPPEEKPQLPVPIIQNSSTDTGEAAPPEPPAPSEGELALERALEFARNNDDYPAVIRNFQRIIDNHPDTPAATAAAQHLEAATRERRELGARFIERIRATAVPYANAQRYSAAIDTWTAARQRAEELGVADVIDRETEILRTSAETAFVETAKRADELVAEGRYDDARRLYTALNDRLGIDEFSQRINQAIADIERIDREQQERAAALHRQEVGMLGRVYAIAPLMQKLDLAAARASVTQLRAEIDGPSKLLDEFEDDLATVESMKTLIIDHVNATSTRSRLIKLHTGRPLQTNSCRATDDHLILQIDSAEMRFAWDRISPDTLLEFARAAAPDNHLMQGVFAHYIAAENAADSLIAEAEKNPETAEKAVGFRLRMQDAVRHRVLIELSNMLDEAEKLVEAGQAEQAGKVLKQVRDKLIDDAPTVARYNTIFKNNSENLAEQIVLRLKEEAAKENWPAVSEGLEDLRGDLAETRNVRVTYRPDIENMQRKCEIAYADPGILRSIRYYVANNDAPARAILTRLATRKGTVGSDARALIELMQINVPIPRGETYANLVRLANDFPDPWQRVSVYRQLAQLHRGTRSEAHARSRIAYTFNDQINRPLWAIEVFKTSLEDFPRYDNWAANAYLHIGRSYVVLEKYQEAVRNFNIVIEKYPEDHAYCTLAVVDLAADQERQGNFDAAAKLYEDGIKKYPFGAENLSHLQNRYGRLLRDKLNQPDKALEAFTSSYTRSPTIAWVAAPALISAARLHREQGREDQARRLLNRVVNDFPGTSHATEAERILAGN